MGAGRPSDYKEEYNEQAYKLCLLGATDKELADFFHVCEATINNWKNEFPEFLVSIRNGKEIADMEVAKSLYLGATDRTAIKQQAIKVKEVQYANGKKVSEVEKIEVVELEEFIPGDFRNAKHWLNNRNPNRWKTKNDVDHTNNGESFQAPQILVTKPNE